MALPYEDGFELMQEMVTSHAEEQLFFRWAVTYQRELSFEEFKHQLNVPAKGHAEDETSADKALETVKNILNMRI